MPLLPGRLGEHAQGQNEPLLGWISREIYSFEPRMTACYVTTGGAAHSFGTLLSLDGATVKPDHRRSHSAEDARSGELAWQEGDRRNELKFTRGRHGHLEIEYTTAGEPNE